MDHNTALEGMIAMRKLLDEDPDFRFATTEDAYIRFGRMVDQARSEGKKFDRWERERERG